MGPAVLRWSVSLMAEGDREVLLEEVVELADAVAGNQGIATGMGTSSYGAQIVVEAESTEEAVERGMTVFTQAVERAGLPVWPVVSVDTVADEEEAGWLEEVPEGRDLAEEDRD
jgi:hypothetical protein